MSRLFGAINESTMSMTLASVAIGEDGTTMRSILSNVVWTLENLFAGLRLAIPAPVNRRSFHFSGDQALILLFLAAGATLFATYPFGAAQAHLTAYAWAILGARCFFVFLLYYLVARIQQAPHTLVALAVTLFSVSIVLTGSQGLIGWIAGMSVIERVRSDYGGLGGYAVTVTMAAWAFAAILRSVRLVYRAGGIRAGVLSAVILLGSMALGWLAPPYFWYVPRDYEAETASDPRVNTEWTYYAQGRLVSKMLAGLAPSRPGLGELYFIGFAGSSTQDVFMKEVRAGQALFDERFDTRGRSLILVNNPRTVEELPAASVSNLRWAINGVARRMDRDNDVLFLYLTSHGSPHLVSVQFPELALNDLEDRTLRDMLDRAGIKWRVVVVSACYSGSMMDALKDDRTLIVTAAAADKTSFGCGDENDWTYFGDAYVNMALRRESSFIAAFERARAIIASRESAERLTPSEPQIYVGRMMEAKLRELDQRLATLPAAAAAPHAPGPE
jgi:hypothetical protein